MAERKTAEIKIRIEPSRKAQWQQAAADEEIGLSEFIVKCVEEHRHPMYVIESVAIGGERPGDLTAQITNITEIPAPSNPSVTTEGDPTKNRDSDWTGDWKPWGDAA